MATGAVERLPAQIRPMRRQRVALVVLAFVLVAIPTSFLIPATDEALGVLGVVLGNATAGLLLIRGGARLGGREGKAWGIAGAGFLTMAGGVFVVAMLNTILDSVPAFGPPDVIFLAGYALVFIGLGMLPHTTGNVTARLRVWLDGLIGAVSLAALMWVIVLADVIGDAFDRSSVWERLAGFGFPILDAIALIVVMIVVVRRGSYRFDVRLLVLAGALSAQLVADTTYLSGLGEDWSEASPVFGFYLIAIAGYVVAGLLVTRRPAEREYADRATALLPMIVPYVTALLLVGLLFARIVGSDLDTLTVELLVATLVVGGLVVGRQAVAIRENRMLVERERAALVSSISHELRTPLTAMLGFLEVLDEDDIPLDPQEREELTGIVHQQAVYMSRIVADLIMLARGKATEISLSESAVPVRGAIDAALSAIPDSAAGTEVLCSDDLVIYADQDRLQQVLVNLLVNAIRYGGDHRAVVGRVDRDHVVIEVHDDGAGVPPRYVLKIWERFERGPNRYDAANPGSGIGLAVVEAVATAHGGSAEYERSPLLGGACFRVRLPARRVVDSVPLKAPSEDTAA
jgi:signal transduction histidine kinase